MRCRLWILWLLSAGAAGAQQRAACAATVFAADGAPLAGAELRCVGAAPPTYDAFASPDVVTATADQRGRCRVELLSDRVYSVHALGPAATDGARAVSPVHEGIAAGGAFALRCGPPAPPARLSLSGLDAWQQLAPLRVRFCADAVSVAWHELPLGDDGTLALPPLPAAPLHMVLLDAGGQPLATATGEPRQGALAVWVPPPRQLAMQVVGDDGKPIAGAEVLLQLDDVPLGRHGDWLGAGVPFEVLRRLGRTDAEGRLLARVPEGRLVLLASAPGRAASWSGWFGGGRVEADRVDPEATERPTSLRFVLAAAPALRGRIVDGGEPVAGLGVQLLSHCKLPSDAFSWYGLSHLQRERTAADGSFAFTSVPASAATLQLALQARPGEPAPRLAVLGAVPPEPLLIDLSALPRLRLQVLTADGGPALAARALLLPSRTDLEPDTAVGLPLDRAGRLELRLQPGRWMVFVSDGDGYALQPLLVAAEDVERQLRLQPLATMRGSVRDAAGQPAVGVGFHLMSSKGSQPASDEVAQWLHHFGFALDRGLLDGVRTGADGRFTLRFVPVASMQYGGSLAGGRGSFQLQEGDGVELQLQR